MEGNILHPNQAIDVGARQRVRCPHVRCPRQPSARPAAAGVVIALQKISWICSCNVPRPLQIERQTTSAAAREENPINRGPGSRQKAPVRERLVGQPLRGELHWPPGPSTVAAHPDTTPSRERRRVLYIPHMEGSTLHLDQAIDIGARQRVRCPHDRCPRQPSARPAAAGVVVALHKISWISSCNVPRPLQIECKTTSTAAMEGNPINRGPGSRQKAPVRERRDSPVPTPTGPLRQPESSTVAADPDTTPSRERRRVLYIPHMEGSIMHPNQAIDIGVRQRVRCPLVLCHQRRPSHPAGSRVPGLVQKKFLRFIAEMSHGPYRSIAGTSPKRGLPQPCRTNFDL